MEFDVSGARGEMRRDVCVCVRLCQTYGKQISIEKKNLLQAKSFEKLV